MRRILTLVGVIGLSANAPAAAQDDDDSASDEIPTLLGYAGLSALDGKNTVGEKAGSIEGHMLASVMALKAAEQVLANLSTVEVGEDKRAILLVGNETVSLAEFYQARRQLDLLEGDTARFLAEVARSRCVVSGNKMAPLSNNQIFSMIESTAATEKDPKFDFHLSDALGAFRTSTEFSAVDVSLGAQLFKNAILSRKNSKFEWVVPSEISQPTGGDQFFDDFVEIRNTLAPYAAGKCDMISEDIGKSAKALLGRADGLAASKDGAPSVLDKAAVAASVMNGTRPLHLLRVDVDKAGGTLVNSSNVFTTLGVPGMTMRGGMIVSYRLLDPTNGRTKNAGIVICRVPKQLLMRITNKPIDQDKVVCETLA